MGHKKEMLRLQRAPGDFGVGKGHGGMDPHGHPPGCTFQPISCPFGKNRFGPVWYTIYHQTNLLLKGFLQTPLLINQPMEKGHLWLTLFATPLGGHCMGWSAQQIPLHDEINHN